MTAKSFIHGDTVQPDLALGVLLLLAAAWGLAFLAGVCRSTCKE
jgi:hypothetical protein